MSSNVTIIDYGIGNLYSVRRAFEVCGVQNVKFASEPSDVLKSDRVVLPGVGAFSKGMGNLKENGLDQAIREFSDSGRPLLGICLGMQLLATVSYEFGKNEGLGVIPGDVRLISVKGERSYRLKIPYVGWSELKMPTSLSWSETIFDKLPSNPWMYFVHSFYFVAENKDHTLATYEYGGEEITAAVMKNNVIGVQFHPEKSAATGLKIIKSFSEL